MSNGERISGRRAVRCREFVKPHNYLYKKDRGISNKDMESISQPTAVSKKMLWAGRILSALPVLMLLFSASGKFLKPAAVIEGFAHLGYPDKLALPLGIVELVCTILYVVPQTAVLGAILLTGYLGGATTTHLRIGEAFIMPVLLGGNGLGRTFLARSETAGLDSV
jgi:hypothetical protein